jgi:hypothetical protein
MAVPVDAQLIGMKCIVKGIEKTWTKAVPLDAQKTLW